jgi:nucleoside-diphosphate-sugar epimerase
MKQSKVLITGAGGFIGNHLVKYLVDRGHWVRGVDIKPPEYGTTLAHEFELLDLRVEEDCRKATADVEEVYALAANMAALVSSRLTRVRSFVTTLSLTSTRSKQPGRTG